MDDRFANGANDQTDPRIIFSFIHDLKEFEHVIKDVPKLMTVENCRVFLDDQLEQGDIRQLFSDALSIGTLQKLFALTIVAVFIGEIRMNKKIN